MSNKAIFEAYLQEKFPDRSEWLMEKFTQYHTWLVDINTKINLISRKMDPDEYWTLHLLDSLLLTEVATLKGETALDFGTGGGLPGIPLALIYPEIEFNLLDSKKKKLTVIGEACDLLEINNVRTIHARLEELDYYFDESFDFIVSRSVRITPELKKPLMKMLLPKGKLYLYKSVQLDDVEQFSKKEIVDVSREEIGTRNIVTITK